MIKIRLSKVGAKGDKFYRIVAVDERKKMNGRALDIIGTWHPRKDILKYSKNKIDFWKEKGAKLTDAVVKLINK